MVEGAARNVKFLVFFFNFLFFVFGVAMIGVGAWAKVQFGDYVELSQKVDYVTGTSLLIAIGVIIAIVAFFGCCGAWKENKCMLIIFFILLLVILAMEIAVAYLGYKHRSEISDELENDLLDEIKSKYGEEDNEGITKAMDKVQERKYCCGAQNYTDWRTSKFAGGSHLKVPDSCCKTVTKGCGTLPAVRNTDKIYTEGCFGKLETLVKEKLYIVATIAITVLVIQILGMIFALVLICKVGKEDTYA